MPLSSSGIGSGLDIRSIVDALVGAEINPAKTRIDRREASFNTELSALGQVKAALTKLQSTLTKLGESQQFYNLKTLISDTNALDATLGEGVLNGDYSIDIQKLAAQQSLASAAFASPATTVGQGSITINFGTYNDTNTTFTANPDKNPVTINIGAGQSSLVGIRDAINSSDSGVKASIVQDESGARLTLTSPETGKKFAMRITVNDNDGTNTNASGLSALAYDPTAGVNRMTQTIAAENSEVKINGLLLTQSSNKVEDAIAGVTLNLKKAQPGTLVNLSIKANQAQVSLLIRDFVKQYNDTMSTFNNLTKYDSVSKKAGALQGDAGIRAIKFSISSLLTEKNADPANPIQTLAALGITTNNDGILQIDDDKLAAVINSNYEDIGALFAKTATASDSLVKIKSVGADVKAGQYNLKIDTFTPGSALSGTINGLTATSSNGLSLKGSGALKNLVVDVTGGGTGARGTITVNDGLAAKFNNLIESYLDENGTITDRTNNINSKIAKLEDDRDKLDYRTSELQRRYLKQFTALDSLLVQLQGTSEFLTQQLSSISQISNPKR